MKYDLFIQQKGGAPSKVEGWSHYNDPIPNDGQPHGHSRRHGDASPAVQAHVIETIIDECVKRGLSKEDTAHVLAIARVESGFNPDAAAGQSSASGVGQFIAKTGAGYGLNDTNRFDLKSNVRALVDHYEDNKELAHAHGKDAAWVYKYHHDGPTQNSGGLALAHKEVIPFAQAYSASPVLANLTSRPRDAVRDLPEAAPSWGQGAPQAEAFATVLAVAEPAAPAAHSGGALEIGKFMQEFTSALESFGQGASNDRASAALAFEPKSSLSGEDPRTLRGVSPVDSRQVGVSHIAEASPAVAELTAPPAGATTIPLGEALAAHMTEKGFDAASIEHAPILALHVLESSILRDSDASALVLHRDGAAIASLTTMEQAGAVAQAGDSVLALDRLEQVAKHGLDTDAIASLRGLAPAQTEPYSDLEVHQAASRELYAKAQDLTAAIDVAAVRDLVAALPSADRLSAPDQLAQQEPKLAKAEVQPSVEMAMGA